MHGLKNKTKLCLDNNLFESLEDEFPFVASVNIECLNLDSFNTKILPCSSTLQRLDEKPISLQTNPDLDDHDSSSKAQSETLKMGSRILLK